MSQVKISDDIVPAWHRRSSCWNYPLNTFFPEHTQIKKKTEFAKSICASCPVLKECMFDVLDYERQHGDLLYGIRAGMTLKERKEWRLCRYTECSTIIGATTGNDVYCSEECKRLKRLEDAKEPEYDFPYQGRLISNA